MKRIMILVMVLCGMMFNGLSYAGFTQGRTAARGFTIPQMGPEILVAANGASVDVKMIANYVCDGVDDDVQINAAILASVVIGNPETGAYGKVILSSGRFNITAPIYVKSGLTLEGAGAWQTNICYVGTSQFVSAISQDGATPISFFVTIRDIGVWGNKRADVMLPHITAEANNYGCGIDASQWSDSKIVNCWVNGFPGRGIKLGTWNMQALNCCVEHCMGYGISGGSEIIGCHLKYNMMGILATEHTKVSNCYVYACSSSALATSTASPYLNTPIITNTLFDSNYRQAVIKFNATSCPMSTIAHPVVLLPYDMSGYLRYLTNGSSDKTVWSGANTLYMKILQGTGGSAYNKVELYKTSTPNGNGIPTFSGLVAHSDDYQTTNTAITLTRDDVPIGAVSITDGTGGKLLCTVSAGHGVVDGDYVVIAGTTNYNATYTTSSTGATSFKVTGTYVSDQTGTVAFRGVSGSMKVYVGTIYGTLADQRASYAVIIPQGDDKWSRAVIDLNDNNTIFSGNRIISCNIAGTDLDTFGFYTIRTAVGSKNISISGNRVIGGPATYCGIRDLGIGNSIQENQIEMLLNTTSAHSSGYGVQANLTGQAAAQVDRFTPVVTTTTAFDWTLTVTDGVTTDTATYTSDATTTVAEVTAGLVAAWNVKRDAGTALFASIDAADAGTSLTLTAQDNLASVANKRGRGHAFYVTGSATGSGNSITRAIVASPASDLIKNNIVQGTITTLTSGIDYGYGRNYTNDNVVIK
jgi:hypothetical protein